MYKVDLHTHSSASPDGGISIEQYEHIISNDILDFVAVTDHNTITAAKQLHASLGHKIIIGEEITTLQGEIVGLFLKEVIRPGQGLDETIQAIKAQGGVVYVPHPFETLRKGINKENLDWVADKVDIVEVYNGRAVAQNKGPEATVWARLQQKAVAAGSDAHGFKGVGTAYTTIKEEPSASNLVELLRYGHMSMRRPPLRTLLYPKAHRFINNLKRKKA